MTPDITNAQNYTLTYLPDDPYAQVAAMTGRMSDAVSAARIPIEQEAFSVLNQDAAVHGDVNPIRAVWNYVREKMRFVSDDVPGMQLEQVLGLSTPVVESLVRPEYMHQYGSGDCDDYVTYGAALLNALGVPVKFCTVAADANEPNVYSHVYLVAYYDGQRIPLDLSHGQHVGWEKEDGVYMRQEWPCGGSGIGLIILAVVAGWLCFGRGARQLRQVVTYGEA
jgi:transglutaminase-like putative cysteine protease